MISVGVTTFFFIIVALPVIVIFFSWLYVEYTHKTKQTKPESQIITRCEICQFPFLHDKDDEISKCPRCGSYLEFK
ncbi:MAG: hypothetical protein KAI43_00825 [Candidatus Aureabacteria bacterium]|nr:hypothetical protein [Candidatus Auribacterota bacterium]